MKRKAYVSKEKKDKKSTLHYCFTHRSTTPVNKSKETKRKEGKKYRKKVINLVTIVQERHCKRNIHTIGFIKRTRHLPLQREQETFNAPTIEVFTHWESEKTAEFWQ